MRILFSWGVVLKSLFSLFLAFSFSSAYGQSTETSAATAPSATKASSALQGSTGGFLLGGAVNSPRFTNEGARRDTNALPGIYAGFFGDLLVTGPVFLSSGLSFAEKKFSSTAHKEGLVTVGNLRATVEYPVDIRVTFRYIEAPLMVRLKPSLGGVRPYLGFGGYGGYLLSFRVDAKNRDGGGEEFKGAKEKFRSLDFGWLANLGTEVPLNPDLGLAIDLRYAQSFVNASAASVEKVFDNVVHRTFTLGAGLTWAI